MSWATTFSDTADVDPLDIVTVLLIALAVFDWIAFGFLYAASRGQRITSLTSRARIALLIAVSSTLSAVLGLNRHVPIIPSAWGWFVLVVIVTLPSFGNLWFLYDLYHGRFRNPPKRD